MKIFFLIFSIILFLSSCNTESKSDKYSEYVSIRVENDTIISEMLQTKNFSNSIFFNVITLKDGQTSKAGISFVMKMDTSTYLVSAKHLLGQDGGFKDSLITDNVSELLSSWKCESISSSKKFSVNTNTTIKNDGDVLLFNSIVDADNVKSFNLTKLILPTTMEGKLDIKNSPKQFYLVGYLPTGKEILHSLTLAGKYESYFVFNKDKEFDYHGLSGGPVLDEKGNVFGILSAGLDDNGKELVLVSRIRPRNL